MGKPCRYGEQASTKSETKHLAEITWYGHACFRLKGKDATIITDPYDKSLGLGTLSQKAEIVTVSHDHPHHNAVSAVKGEPYVARGPGEYEVRGVFVTGVWSFADDQKGKERGRNTIFLFHLGDSVVCHLGSLGHTLNSQQLEAIGDVDVLLVPIGANTALTTTKATEVITQIVPKIVVPMHYERKVNGGENEGELDALARFAKEMGLKEWEVQDKLVVKGSDLPETTHVVILEAKS